MNIAQIAAPWFRVPPKRYGGPIMSISLLTEGLVRKGHNVTLFASGDSKTHGKLSSIVKKSLSKSEKEIDWSESNYTLFNIYNAIKDYRQFDILHFHISNKYDYASLLFADLLKTNCVFTIRCPVPEISKYPARAGILKSLKHLNYVSVSYSQRKEYLPLNWIANIYNAVDLDLYKFNPTPQNYFLCVGMIQSTKGVHLAIQVAKKAGVKLIIAGRIEKNRPEFYDYWNKKVKPFIDGKSIIYVGETTRKQTAKLMGGARGFLNPIQWDEPFGLTMIESMACGTPVITFTRGSTKEIVINKKTGFIVRDLDQMVGLINKIDNINRYNCYEHVKNNFTPDIMVEKYEAVYKNLLLNKQ